MPEAPTRPDPGKRRSRTKIDPNQKKEELEEKGAYVSPTREAETKPGPIEEPPDHRDDELVDLQEEAERIFQDELGRAAEFVAQRTTSLHEKLIKVMEAVDAVEKRGENQAQRYKYQRATDVFRAIRPEFIKQGLRMTTSVHKTNTTLIERGAGKGPNVLVEIECTFHVTDGHEEVEFSGAGAGIDASGDKSVYKAITGCMKYGIRQLLMLPDENDPERDRPGEAEEVSGGPITINPSGVLGVTQGGRQSKATQAQIDSIRESASELGLKVDDLIALCSSVLGKSPDARDPAGVIEWLGTLTFEECGAVAKTLWQRRQETADAEGEE